jgi:imidazolonepropionase-like amidohydrolase
VERIDAAILILGRGDLVSDASVVIDGSSIVYAEPRNTAPEIRSPISVPCLMPGLWDCHAHFLSLRSLDVNELAIVPMAVLAARAAKDAEAALQAGFTTVCEAGGLGVYLARVVEEGLLSGPSILCTGFDPEPNGRPRRSPRPFARLDERSVRGGGAITLCDGIPA